MITFLLDENVDPALRRGLLKREPEMDIWKVGESGSLPLGTLDPVILRWCEENGTILVTNNRRSMPQHLSDHMSEGRHIPGILFLDDDLSMGETIEALLLVWGASFPGEYQDRLVYLKQEFS